ncbi:MAG: rhomboid family intramembrane serine protease [Proteobacteria bacterium]|nr:rhomboid family intramembrane serine protease [Pseudomonadota bacterium]
MFPLRDSIPRVHVPYAVYALIALNALAFAYTLTLTRPEVAQLFHLYGVVPARFSHPLAAQAVGYPAFGLQTFVTYMFLHGGWLHVIVNMWTLWIFADNIEDVMGPLRFVGFYLSCGLAALGVHYLFNPESIAPVVGASGAIAGVMGAYFLLYPHAKVVTLIPIFIFPLILNIPAVLYLGIWFAAQFFSGVSDLASSGSGAGIAWWAHAGGFVAGMLLLPLFRKKGRCYFCAKPDGQDFLRRRRDGGGGWPPGRDF